MKKMTVTIGGNLHKGWHMKKEIYWEGLPLYARQWIKHDYDRIQTVEDYENFINKYLMEYHATKNRTKRLAIAMVVLPIHERFARKQQRHTEAIALSKELIE